MFFVFRDSYVLCIYVMNILCMFHISVSWVWYIDLFGARAKTCRSWHGYELGSTCMKEMIRETAKIIGSISNGFFRRWKEREKTQGPQKKKKQEKSLILKTRKKKFGAPSKKRKEKKKNSLTQKKKGRKKRKRRRTENEKKDCNQRSQENSHTWKGHIAFAWWWPKILQKVLG